MSYFSSYIKKELCGKNSKRKFYENFDTSKFYVNCCIGVLWHAGHESGLSFLITIDKHHFILACLMRVIQIPII